MRVIWETFLSAGTHHCALSFQVDVGAARLICVTFPGQRENHGKGVRGEQQKNHGSCGVTTQETLFLWCHNTQTMVFVLSQRKNNCFCVVSTQEPAQVRTEAAPSATSSPGACRFSYSSGAAECQVRYGLVL